MIDTKYFLYALTLFVCIFAVAWTFNHFNPWVGIALAFIILLGINQYFKNKK